MARFLFVTIPAQGHVAPLAQVATALVQRGHEVMWYTSSAFADTVTKTGAAHRPLLTPVDFGNGDLDRHFPERTRYRGLRRVVFDFEVFARDAEGYVTDLRALVEEFRPDAVVTDPAVIAASVLSEVDGLPTATVNVTVLAVPSRDLAPFGLGLPPTSSWLGALRNRLLTALVDHVVFARPNGVYRRIARSHGWPVLPIRPRTGPWLFLHPSVESFEYPRSDLPPQIHFIGPLLPTPPPLEREVWQDELAAARAAGRRVVLVTQGTVATDPDELITPTLAALADADLLVLVAGADPADLGPLPANARVQPFVPFGPLMPHVDAYVTNGGYGGVIIALASGVPVVVAGTTEDKAEVGGRVAYSGVGINLRTSNPLPQVVGQAVRTVLADPTYRQAAQCVAADLGAHDGPAEAAALLETLAATGAPVLRSAPALAAVATDADRPAGG
ncbi:MAG: glycosyltransferase [Actinomycetes bacterium]